MADIFDVVSDPTRRQLLQALLEQLASRDSDTGEISVGDLVDRLGISQPTVSKHLKVLRDHGLVTVREDGQHRYYRLDSTPLEALEDWLVPFLADFGDDELPIDDGGAAVFAAWSGTTDAGENLGRKLAEGQFQARSVIQDASHAVQRLPEIIRRRPFRKG